MICEYHILCYIVILRFQHYLINMNDKLLHNKYVLINCNFTISLYIYILEYYFVYLLHLIRVTLLFSNLQFRMQY